MRKFIKLPSGLIVPKRPGVKRSNCVAGLSRRAFLSGLGSAIIVPKAIASNLVNSYAIATPVATSTYQGQFGDVTDLITYTFSSCDFGTASSDRYIALFIHHRSSGSARTVTSVTIGGVSATLLLGGTVANGLNGLTLVIAAVPTGTTGQTVSITFSSTVSRCGITIYRLNNLTSPTPSNTLQSILAIPTGTIDVPVNGTLIAGGTCTSSATTTWTGVTEDVDVVVETNTVTSGHIDLPAGETGRTITATYSTGSNEIMIGASFG